MDESLTHFLKNSSQPIPYHTQVNICHDIALALSFLHGNDIVHRDLSSNNVLLIGDIRAKVTDFGMARLGDVKSQVTHLSFTTCPGTEVYMPPETALDKPVYSEKIDCFSFGVLTIQILTKQYPKPENRLRNVNMKLSGVPGGEFMVIVPEIERRQNHICMVETGNPLLSLSLDCLKDEDHKRPTSKKLCQILSALKEDQKYRESVECTKERNKLDLKKKEDEIKLLKLQHSQQVEDLQQIVRSQKKRLEEAEQHSKEQEKLIQVKEQIIVQQSLMIHEKKQKLSKNEQQEEIVRQKESVILSKERAIQALREQQKQMMAELNREAQARKGIEKQLEKSEEFLAKFQRRILELEKQLKQRDELAQEEKHKQQQNVQPLPGKCDENLTTNVSHQLRTGGGMAPQSSAPALRLKWRKDKLGPRTMCRGPDPIVSGNIVYFAPFNTLGSGPILCYKIADKSWFEIHGYPYSMNGFALAVFNNMLTGIGGSGEGGYTNKLISLKFDRGRGTRWTEVLPPMPTKRSNASVLVASNKLIVIGGRNENTSLTVTEVLNIETRQWHSSLSLPESVSRASITICSDRVYLLGGETGRFFNSIKSVYSCSLSGLLQYRPQKQFGTALVPSVNRAHKWSMCANLPVTNSTCISFQGHLLAIGGEDSDLNYTTAVHIFDPSTNRWNLTDHMQTGRSCCFVAILPDNQLMVVGGRTKRALIFFPVVTNEVEFATIE